MAKKLTTLHLGVTFDTMPTEKVMKRFTIAISVYNAEGLHGTERFKDPQLARVGWLHSHNFRNVVAAAKYPHSKP